MGILDSVIGGIFGQKSARDTNQANRNINATNIENQNYQAGRQRWFNSKEAVIARDWAADQVETNRQFQERMSNSAVSRRMNDLAASGINPILAGKYDASSPPGSTLGGASASSPGGSFGSSIPMQDEGFSAVQAARIAQEMSYSRSQARKAKAEAQITEAGVPTAELEEEIKREIIKAGKDYISKGKGGNSASQIGNYLRDLRIDAEDFFGKTVDSLNPMNAVRDAKKFFKNTTKDIPFKWKTKPGANH